MQNQPETLNLEPSEGGERPKKSGRSRKSVGNSTTDPRSARGCPPSESPMQLTVKEPSVALMLQQVIQSGITKENVAALESIVGLYDRMKAKESEKQYAEAFSKLQAGIKRVQAIHPVPAKDGTIKYYVAKFSEVWNEVEPLIIKNGFTASFSQKYEDGLPLRVTTIFILQHTHSGHKTETGFTVRVGNGPPGCNDYQADGAASSYAKMRSMCSCLNIIIEHDDDVRMIGQPIGTALAQDLMERVRACGANEVAFLKFAGVTIEEGLLPVLEDYEKIGLNRFDALDEILKKKEGRRV